MLRMRVRTLESGSRSMHKSKIFCAGHLVVHANLRIVVFIAKRVTSKIQARTSIGRFPKEVEDQSTQ